MLRGRCACNAIGYEVADEFVVAYNCHCSNCRAMNRLGFPAVGRDRTLAHVSSLALGGVMNEDSRLA